MLLGERTTVRITVSVRIVMKTPWKLNLIFWQRRISSWFVLWKRTSDEREFVIGKEDFIDISGKKNYRLEFSKSVESKNIH